MTFKSEIPLSEWRGDLTLFSGFYETAPAAEIKDCKWGVVIANIAPQDGLALVAKKENAPYFISCRLTEAPLVEKTLQKAIMQGLPTVGKQRSASHVTEANMITADLDGITPDQLAVIENRLIDAELTYLLYSSHSYGRPDKPGMRCRLVLPIDSALDGAQYKLAAQALNATLLDSLADPSGFAMHQQQGMWATAKEREHLAFRRSHKDGVCSAAALLSAAPKTGSSKPQHLHVVPNAGPLPLEADRIIAALKWADPNDYDVWFPTAPILKAAYGDAAFPIWVAWSDTADDAHKEKNDGAKRLDKVWTETTPKLTTQQAASTLYARARDAAMEAAKASAKTGLWDRQGVAALTYLRRYHPRLFAQTFEAAA